MQKLAVGHDTCGLSSSMALSVTAAGTVQAAPFHSAWYTSLSPPSWPKSTEQKEELAQETDAQLSFWALLVSAAGLVHDEPSHRDQWTS